MLGVADGGVDSRIRHADHNIRRNRMLYSEICAGTRSRFMNGTAVYNRIGACEINILENAHFVRLFSAMICNAAYSVFIEYNNFARLDIAYQLRSHRVKRATFRSDNPIAFGGLAVAQGAKTVLVSYRDKFRGRHDHQRVSAFYAIHRMIYRVFDRCGFQTFLDDYVGNNLGIGCGMENRAFKFKFASEFV